MWQRLNMVDGGFSISISLALSLLFLFPQSFFFWRNASASGPLPTSPERHQTLRNANIKKYTLTQNEVFFDRFITFGLSYIWIISLSRKIDEILLLLLLLFNFFFYCCCCCWWLMVVHCASCVLLFCSHSTFAEKKTRWTRIKYK